MTRTFPIATVLLALACVGCRQGGTAQRAPAAAPVSDPKAYLLWSKGIYAGLHSFQADCAIKMKSPGTEILMGTRRVLVTTPNHFFIHADTKTASFTTVCDGSKELDYSGEGSIRAEENPAPTTLATASTDVLTDADYCGSVLWHFLSDDQKFFDNLGPVSFGASKTAVGGEPAREVKFFEKKSYGDVVMLVGQQTGKIYRIEYDSEPLLGGQATPNDSATNLYTVEAYSNIDFNSNIPNEKFNTAPPKGVDVAIEENETAAPKPPIQPGTMAPDITVTDLASGRPVKISSLRGKVVMIDFWATWCPPCREGLPHTDAIFKDLGPKGLQVLTVSDEESNTITDYLKKQKLTVPAYRDGDGSANQAYQIEGIPTVVIIDASGKVSDMMVGLRDEAQIRGAIKKAGFTG